MIIQNENQNEYPKCLHIQNAYLKKYPNEYPKFQSLLPIYPKTFSWEKGVTNLYNIRDYSLYVIRQCNFFFTTTLLPNSIRIGLQNKYCFFLFKLQYDSCGIYICSLAQLIRNSKKMIFCDL